eukprot:Awhi_evm1s344
MSKPLNKEGRAVCWGNRDAYFKCLDEHRDGTAEHCPPCDELKKAFEETCPASW